MDGGLAAAATKAICADGRGRSIMCRVSYRISNYPWYVMCTVYANRKPYLAERKESAERDILQLAVYK